MQTKHLFSHPSKPALVLFAAASSACFGATDPATVGDSVESETVATESESESGGGSATDSDSDSSSTDSSSTETTDSTDTTTTDDTSTTDSTTTDDTTTTDTSTDEGPECGNGLLEDGELCDDGNFDDSDLCTSACQPASCDDGLHNGDESDLDCGGSCEACLLGAGCGEGADCDTFVCVDAVCSHPESCADLHAQAPELPSGIYWIDIDAEGAAAPFEVACEMETDGGGWTLLQRTVWDPAETLPLKTNYQTWLSTPIGSLDPGRGYRMAGMYWESFNAAKDHLLVHYMRRAANLQSCDPLYYKGTGGDLNVGMSTTYLTGLASSVPMTNSNIELSTTSSGPSQFCVNDYKGTPWFYAGCGSTIPTYQGPYWSEPHPMINYSTTPDLFGHTRTDVCGGDALPPLQGPANGFRGVNAMEYYIR